MNDKNLSIGEIADLIVQSLRERDITFREMVSLAKLDPSTDFVGADLSYLDLSDEDLSGFNFNKADISFSNFSRACLRGTTFDDAYKEGAIGLAESVSGIDTQQIFTLLSDNNSDIRREALELVGIMEKTNEVLHQIIKRTKDHDESIKIRAYELLSSEEISQEMRHIIRKGFKDNNVAVRKSAVFAYQADAQEVLRDALRHNDADVRTASISRIVSQFATDEDLIESVKAALSHDAWFIRSNAADIVRALPYRTDLFEILAHLLKDKDTQVQIAAAKAIGQHTSSIIGKDIIYELIKHPTLRVRRTSIAALVHYYDLPEVRAAIGNPLGDPDWQVRATAVTAMAARLNDPNIVHILKQALKDVDTRVRYAALDAIGKGERNTDFFHKIRDCLQDNDPDIRSHALTLISHLSQKEEVQKAISNLLSDPFPNVAVNAANSLARHMGSAAVHKAFEIALRKGVSRGVIQTIVDCRSQNSTSLLVYAIRNTSLKSAKHTIELISRLIPENVVLTDCLVNILKDTRSNLRTYAAAALTGAANQEKVTKLLMTSCLDEDLQVAAAAIRALRTAVHQKVVFSHLILILESEFDNQNKRQSSAHKSVRDMTTVRCSLLASLSFSDFNENLLNLLTRILDCELKQKVRKQCIIALGAQVERGGPPDVLIRLATKDRSSDANAAMDALCSRITDEKVRRIFRDAASGDDINRKIIAINGLSRVASDSDVNSLLKELLSYNNEKVRLAAMKALKGENFNYPEEFYRNDDEISSDEN